MDDHDKRSGHWILLLNFFSKDGLVIFNKFITIHCCNDQRLR